MKTDILPLPEAALGREYTIESVNDGKLLAEDLRGYGLIPGAGIKPLFASPSGDPCAYEIMGTVIALRNDDSKYIKVMA